MSKMSIRTLDWNSVQKQIVACTLCPRLREYGDHVALEKRAAYRDQDYWGKPVPNFGSPTARLLLVGLAPGAHGSHRTGRMFTGDRSGEFLFRAMYETGFATQPDGTRADDGLELIDAAITAVCHCAPPDNKPTPAEIIACNIHLERTIHCLKNLRAVLALGRIGFDATVRMYRARGWLDPTDRPKFAHGAEFIKPGSPALLATYHPSQQNTFTGKLTPEMLRRIFERARTLIR